MIWFYNFNFEFSKKIISTNPAGGIRKKNSSKHRKEKTYVILRYPGQGGRFVKRIKKRVPWDFSRALHW